VSYAVSILVQLQLLIEKTGNELDAVQPGVEEFWPV
jgi:hypothetical protein